MSYILEALRRAQDERQAQPTLAAQGGATGQAQNLREAPPWLLAALAGAGGVLAAALLAWALWPERPPAVAPPPPMAEPAASAPAPAATESIRSLDDLTTSDTGAWPAENYFKEVPPLADDALMEMETAGGVPPAAAAAPEAGPQSSGQTVQLEPAPAAATPLLRDMPEDYRAAFPKLKVEVHVYDDNPAERFVLIEGRRYREGEALPQGAQLSAITSDGIVCSFRGEDVLLPVGY